MWRANHRERGAFENVTPNHRRILHVNKNLYPTQDYYQEHQIYQNKNIDLAKV